MSEGNFKTRFETLSCERVEWVVDDNEQNPRRESEFPTIWRSAVGA